ncbi:MAG TPA: hypothetical protein VN812_22825, partial [Candidatus Acidoferrales bacterium]|nr:hypothetical protein [Candidatus Acidoferrales bacterium]
ASMSGIGSSRNSSCRGPVCTMARVVVGISHRRAATASPVRRSIRGRRLPRQPRRAAAAVAAKPARAVGKGGHTALVAIAEPYDRMLLATVCAGNHPSAGGG